MKKKQPLLSKLFSGSGWTLFTLFTWEMMEELLEEAIAFGITSFITKALSTLFVIGITQITKKAIIRLCKPIVKTFTYKEGKDKMGKVKQFFTWIWSNKKTLMGVTSGAVLTLSGAEVIDVSALPELPIGGFNITPIIYYGALLVLALVGVFGKGLESIKEYAERIEQQKAEKEQKAIVKEAQAEIKAEQKLANQTQAQQEKATAKAEAEKLAKAEQEKAEAEHRAKVEKAKAKILAEKQASAN